MRASTTAARTGESPEYLSRQLLTYLGNKRALLDPIAAATARVQARLGGRPLHILDSFSGSGVVSRLLKGYAARLISNDIEEYAATMARCFLRNTDDIDHHALNLAIAAANAYADSAPLPPGFIEELYAPRDEARITSADRVFYTRENARRIDHLRQSIATAPAELHDLLLGPLLSAASVHANTAGVFKGFYKDRRTKIGRYGGTGSDALQRIRAKIRLQRPVLSRFHATVEVYREDANELVRRLRGLDLAYIDPPYNQHPYGSNYFMLNLIVRYERPQRISRVSGIPEDWQRSAYNIRDRAVPLLSDLIAHTDASHLLVTCNDEGYVGPIAMRELLRTFGRVDSVAIPYTAFRGSRNLDARPLRVTEHLFLVERR